MKKRKIVLIISTFLIILLLTSLLIKSIATDGQNVTGLKNKLYMLCFQMLEEVKYEDINI